MYNRRKNGWHDDNRRGVDTVRGNRAHYKGRGRVYGLVNHHERVALSDYYFADTLASLYIYTCVQGFHGII